MTNVSKFSNGRLLDVAGSAYYPPIERESCIVELSARIRDGKKVF